MVKRWINNLASQSTLKMRSRVLRFSSPLLLCQRVDDAGECILCFGSHFNHP